MHRNIKWYGWQKDLPDFRDFKLAHLAIDVLPASVDLSKNAAMPPIYDQGDLGSCTANAIAGALEYLQRTHDMQHDYMPSRLFIYYNERAIEGSVSSDSGAQIRDGIKTMNKQGVCSENIWPYNITRFAKKPSADCYKKALAHRITSYTRLNPDVTLLKTVLAHGSPFVFGFTVYQSFESNEVANTGILPMPANNENVLGGHAVCCVGYIDQYFIVRNSWGTDWGMQGYFKMPFSYFTPDLTSDFWMINK